MSTPRRAEAHTDAGKVAQEPAVVDVALPPLAAAGAQAREVVPQLAGTPVTAEHEEVCRATCAGVSARANALRVNASCRLRQVPPSRPRRSQRCLFPRAPRVLPQM